MSSLALKLLGLDESSSIRGMIGPDAIQVFSVYDFMTVACGYKDTGAAARKEFKRLTSEGSTHEEEIVASCHSLRFPGQRGPGTPCMTIRGLQRLLMILGGKVAAKFREIIEGTFTRVMAGDQSLIEVINANAASRAPVQKAYRAALAQEPVDPVLDDFCLKRKRERDEKLLDLDLVERKLRLDEEQLRLEEGKHRLEVSKRDDEVLGQAGKFVKLFETINEMPNIDEDTRQNLRVKAKDVLLSTPSTSSAAASAGQAEPILYVSNVAEKMGFKCSEGELQSIGKLMADKYRAAHDGKGPPKREQKIKGGIMLINSYTEQDQAMMEQAVREVMADESDDDDE